MQVDSERSTEFSRLYFKVSMIMNVALVLSYALDF